MKFHDGGLFLVVAGAVWLLPVFVNVGLSVAFAAFALSPRGRIFFAQQTGEARRRIPTPLFTLPAGVRHSAGMVMLPRAAKSGPAHDMSTSSTMPACCACYAQQWLPAGPPKALVFFLQGYSDHSNYWQQENYILMAQQGYAAFTLDYEGHGRSDGLHVYIPDVNVIVADLAAHYSKIKAQYPGIKSFIWGESMGGALGLYLSTRHPELVDGAIFIAPMCKLSDKLKPAPPVIAVFSFLAQYLPTLPIAPVPDVATRCFKRPETLAKARRSPIQFPMRPRLATAYEMLRVSLDIEANVLSQMAKPFLVVHGKADTVTDPASSEHLYERACSSDKSIKLYEGMWHCLLAHDGSGESAMVMGDIFEWIAKRV